MLLETHNLVIWNVISHSRCSIHHSYLVGGAVNASGNVVHSDYTIVYIDLPIHSHLLYSVTVSNFQVEWTSYQSLYRREVTQKSDKTHKQGFNAMLQPTLQVFSVILLSCIKLEFPKKQALHPFERVAFLQLWRSCRWAGAAIFAEIRRRSMPVHRLLVWSRNHWMPTLNGQKHCMIFISSILWVSTLVWWAESGWNYQVTSNDCLVRLREIFILRI